MNSHKLRFAAYLMMSACLLLTSPAASAADKNHSAGETAILLAGTADFTLQPISVAPLRTNRVPASAGVADTLPDLPAVSADFRVLSAVTRTVKVSTPESVQSDEPRISISNVKLADSPGVGLLQSSPLADAARRIGAERFNTDDGSSMDAFAICYRLNRRSSVQVIPGDPAPVKIPVSTFANNVGITVGMVIRLSRQQ